MPVFGGSVPRVARERLKRVGASAAPAVLVAVFGGRAYEEELTELVYEATSAGFVPVAAIAAVAERSMARQFAAGRPDEQDASELVGFGERIREALEQGAGCSAALEVPGEVAEKPSKPAATPLPTADCTGCMACARACPTGAIDPSDPSKVDAARCLGCMRCVSACSFGARELAPVVLEHVGSFLAAACPERATNELYLR